jgi:hypothetical protein
MTAHECPRERETVLGLRRGALDGELAEHARECAACAEAVAVTGALASLADAELPSRTRVDARVLWLKAQLAPRAVDPAAGGAASRGVVAVWAAVAVCWAGFLAWRWPDLRHLLESLTPQRLLTGAADPGAIPMASLAAVMIMAAITLAIMLHQVFVEEL